jgi:hypothetical protein
MYKDIIKLIYLLVSKPQKAWEELAKDEPNQEEFLSKYLYPIIGAIAAIAFLSILLTRDVFSFEVALKSSILSLIVSFGGFFLASYLLNECGARFFNMEKDMRLCQRFVGYGSSLMYALNVILMLLPEFFFLRILVLYTFYMIWDGAPIYMGVSDNERMKYTSIASAIILIVPIVVEKAVIMLMPGLNLN